MSIEIIKDKCTGCSICLKVCPFAALVMSNKKAVVDLDKCTLCGACQDACPFKAIEIKRESSKTPNIEAYKGVWVFGEQKRGVIQSVVYELLGKGRELADKLGVELSCVVLGHNIKEKCQELIHRGADNIYIVDAPELEHYLDEPYTNVLVSLIRKYRPEIFLCGATIIGRSLISRVAVKIHTGLTADCTGLDVDVKERFLLQTRPAFGGNIMATILSKNHRPQMATVRHKVFKEAAINKNHKGKIIVEDVPKINFKSRTKLLDIVEEITSTVNIAEADIIVSGGRGMKGPENFAMLEELAKVLGGAVGSSRAAVDSGWMPYSHQVGQTGKTVCPKIYIACGISGQIQHLVGMQSSEIIIAINQDASAPIFNVATYGIVGDVFQIVPLLTRKFKEALNR
ncbi:MAG TPA: electron transfer flavoprotein subunit alpha [Candidatus Omnitrophota bacterium]|nr:electron transfer flavoprotein subunit alpha [Candidatus Omnitrophota bacterium]